MSGLNSEDGSLGKLSVAENWYARTALEDLCGVGAESVNKDRLYRALDKVGAHKDRLCDELLKVNRSLRRRPKLDGGKIERRIGCWLGKYPAAQPERKRQDAAATINQPRTSNHTRKESYLESIMGIFRLYHINKGVSS